MKSNIGERKEIGTMDINTALTVFLGLCAAITAIGSAATYIGKAKSKNHRTGQKAGRTDPEMRRPDSGS